MEECLQTAVLHIQQLNCLCRICGSRSKKFCFDRKALLCTLHTDAIRIHHDLGISHGKRSHHSETICRKCYMCLAKLKKTDSEHTAQTAKYGIGKSFSMWTKPTVFTRFLPQVLSGSHQFHVTIDVLYLTTSGQLSCLKKVARATRLKSPRQLTLWHPVAALYFSRQYSTHIAHTEPSVTDSASLWKKRKFQTHRGNILKHSLYHILTCFTLSRFRRGAGWNQNQRRLTERESLY